MAIKYVEDYRIGDPGTDTTSDRRTIQAAVDDLENGDTLVFNKVDNTNTEISVTGYTTLVKTPGTYTLDGPIYFTSYNSETGVGTSRHSITLEGNNRTITNCPSFDTPHDDRKIMFLLSDESNNGLYNSTIRGFHFRGDNRSDTSCPLVALGPRGNIGGSPYIRNCTITNCYFERFGVAMYLCGFEDTVKNCNFFLCTRGINADCPNYAHIHSNFFQDSSEVGIMMTKPVGSEVYNNSFHHCRGNYIHVDGTMNKELPENTSDIRLRIYSNVMEGGIMGDNYYNQCGIYIHGVKSLIIKDNIIRNMMYDSTDENAADYGIGIFLNGINLYNHVENGKPDPRVRYCEKVIVSGNIISGCLRYGIRANYTYDSVLSDNLIYKNIDNIVYINTDSEPIDFAIWVDQASYRLHITGNTLYCYDNNNGLHIIDPTEQRNFNNYNFTEEVYNTQIHSADPSLLVIPAYANLVDKKHFYANIPTDYNAPTISRLGFEGAAGEIYKEGSDGFVDLSEYSGETVRLQYNVSSSKYSNESIISFNLIEEDILP